MKKITKAFSDKSPNIFQSGYFLTDGGLETTLIFHHHVALAHFAAFELLSTSQGRESLKNYYEPYVHLAAQYDLTYILETPTWRSNADWGFKLGYSSAELDNINRSSVLFLRELQQFFSAVNKKTIISGCVGPRGDGYSPKDCMSTAEAMKYHSEQIRAFALADVDFISAMTMNYSEEAIGIARAAQTLGVPAVISFTVETDGKLPNGENLKDAIEQVDLATNNYAQHFMINCAHPEHFRNILETGGDWKNRIRGIRANASLKSHAELNESEALDTGDKCMLAQGYVGLRNLLPDLRIVGGCCGTDHTHLEEICRHMFH